MKNKLKSANLKIDNCMQCPFLERKRVYTSDSWEEGYQWICKKMDRKVIASFVEWNEADSIKVPDWCPLRK